MAFCGNCGMNLGQGLNFCPGCGAPCSAIANVSNTHVAYSVNTVQQSQAIRNQSIVEMDRMMNHFGPKLSEYDEYDDLNKRASFLKKDTPVLALTFGLISLFIAGMLFLYMAVNLNLSFGRESLADYIGLIAVVGVFAAGGVLLIVYNSKVSKKSKDKLDSMLERIDELAFDLERHYYAYGPCLIGIEYSNPRILTAVMNMIRSGRADTPKEAINRMLEDEHVNKMLIQMDMTTKAARSAANGARVAAAFSAASFFAYFL